MKRAGMLLATSLLSFIWIIKLFHSWKYYSEDCPLEGLTAWGTDETLNVTSQFLNKIDPDVYTTIIGLAVMGLSLLVLVLVMKCFGKKSIHLEVWVMIVSLKTRKFRESSDGLSSRATNSALVFPGRKDLTKSLRLLKWKDYDFLWENIRR